MAPDARSRFPWRRLLGEDHGGFGLIRSPADRAILNYLRKYYMHGWSFRHAMKNAPTICLPDDHDVFQGNIWGEAGAPMKEKGNGASSLGGYIEPAEMVNVVHTTNCAHHPDYYDPTLVGQGISVYYGGHGVRRRELCNHWRPPMEKRA